MTRTKSIEPTEGRENTISSAQTVRRARRSHDRLLGEALEQTFPASDPIAMQQAVVAGGGGRLPGAVNAREARRRSRRRRVDAPGASAPSMYEGFGSN
jgi:hypothetical protein